MHHAQTDLFCEANHALRMRKSRQLHYYCALESGLHLNTDWSLQWLYCMPRSTYPRTAKLGTYYLYGFDFDSLTNYVFRHLITQDTDRNQSSLPW